MNLPVVNRRQFLQAATAAVALSSRSASARSTYGNETYDRSKVRRVGLIGTGWYGKSDLFRLIQVSPVEVVSLCDVDSVMLSKCAADVASRQASKKTPRTYSDYRKMLAEKDLDIVLIATPDHWHALPMIEAAKSGVDIYCQKPISVDVVEGQAMLAAARKYNRVVQIGTQRRSTPHLVEARDRFIKTGKLGKIGSVDICCYYHMRASGVHPPLTPPATLDWETWTGPAPMRPYNDIVHPRGWRAFMEYCNGIVGDMCVHMLDMTRWMLDLGWPSHIASTGGIYVDKESTANITDTQSCSFQFPDLVVNWEHRSWGDAPDPDPKYAWSAIFYGDKGTLKASVYAYDFIGNNGEKAHKDVTMEFDLFPEDKDEVELEKHVAPAIRHHMMDFLSAIDNRSKPVADIEQGYISTASCILANNALKLGRKFTWDAATQQVVNDAEANQLLQRPYRAPWVHPDPKRIG
jgi:predicted dehydrogenase